MKIFAPTCSQEGCGEDAEYVASSPNIIKLYCLNHSNSISDGTSAQSLEFKSERYKRLNQLQSLKSKFQELRFQLIKKADKLIKTIHSCLQSTLLSIEQNIKNIDLNTNYILKYRKNFIPILEILDKMEGFDPKISENNFEMIKSDIFLFFNRSCFHPINIKKNHSHNYSLLVDLRLLDEKTSSLKKLRILSKTRAYNSINENKSKFKDSKKILVSLEKSMIFTISHDDMKIIYWKINDEICFVNEVKYNFGIEDIFDIPGSRFILVYFKYFLAKIDLDNIAEIKVEGRGSGIITELKFFPNYDYIATPTTDRFLKIWKCSDLDLISEERINDSNSNGLIMCFDISYNGKMLAFGNLSGNVVLLYNPIIERFPLVTKGSAENSSKRISIVNGHKGEVSAIAFNPDASLIISGGEDKYIKLWKTQDFLDLISSKKVPKTKIKEILFSIDSKSILTCCPNIIILYNTKDLNSKPKEIKDKESLLTLHKDFPNLTKFFKYLR